MGFGFRQGERERISPSPVCLMADPSICRCCRGARSDISSAKSRYGTEIFEITRPPGGIPETVIMFPVIWLAAVTCFAL